MIENFKLILESQGIKHMRMNCGEILAILGSVENFSDKIIVLHSIINKSIYITPAIPLPDVMNKWSMKAHKKMITLSMLRMFYIYTDKHKFKVTVDAK